MSITPYNNLTVRDLNGNQQSYVNSTTEVGYFSGEYSGTIPNGRIFSLPVFLKTNNGIASVDGTNGMFGLTILNSGVYKINLSLFPTSTQDGSSNISFNFGTSQILYDPSTNVVNAFGGVCPIGMFTYDPSNNPSFPGIISWVADGYSSANSTISNFVQNPLTYELAYNYNNAGYLDKKLYSGISTTEMTFVVDSSVNIFLNVCNNSNTDITMGKCCFTLKLMTTPFTSVRTWRWTPSDAIVTDWFSITSSQTGQYLAAVSGYPWTPVVGNIYTSWDYGATWILRNNNPATSTARAWFCITSSASGRYLAATVRNGRIYTSNDYGANWVEGGPTPFTTRLWGDITLSRDGSKIAVIAQNNLIYVSSNFGQTWRNITPLSAGQRISMTDSTQYLCSAGDGATFIASTNGGTNWTQSIPGTAYWAKIVSSIDGKHVYSSASGNFYRSSNYGVNIAFGPGIGPQSVSQITTSSNGQYLAAAGSGSGNGVYLSSNYGNTWTRQTSGITLANFGCIASSGDGTRLAAGAINGRILIGVFS